MHRDTGRGDRGSGREGRGKLDKGMIRCVRWSNKGVVSDTVTCQDEVELVVSGWGLGRTRVGGTGTQQFVVCQDGC